MFYCLYCVSWNQYFAFTNPQDINLIKGRIPIKKKSVWTKGCTCTKGFENVGEEKVISKSNIEMNIFIPLLPLPRDYQQQRTTISKVNFLNCI